MNSSFAIINEIFPLSPISIAERKSKARHCSACINVMENQFFYSSFNNCSLIREKEKAMRERGGGDEKACQISSYKNSQPVCSLTYYTNAN